MPHLSLSRGINSCATCTSKWFASLSKTSRDGLVTPRSILLTTVLSTPASSPISFSNQIFLARWPELVTLLNGLSGSQLFLILLALAVLLQALQSYTKFLNNLSTSYFSARCRAIVTARIHSQLLSLSYACASSYKVGDLTDHAFWGPESIRNQIEQYSNMLVGGMLCFT